MQVSTDIIVYNFGDEELLRAGVKKKVLAIIYLAYPGWLGYNYWRLIGYRIARPNPSAWLKKR